MVQDPLEEDDQIDFEVANIYINNIIIVRNRKTRGNGKRELPIWKEEPAVRHSGCKFMANIF